MLPEVQSFLDSDQYRQANYGDELLYRVANANLDRFIDVVGRDVFQEALGRFRAAKSMVESHCPAVKGKCDAFGNFVKMEKRDKCYYQDYGCGYECADKLFDNGKIGAEINQI